jgi:hypothetical protein
MTSWIRKLKWLMRRPEKEGELQEELQFHLEEEAGERQAQGLAAEEARRAAPAGNWETSLSYRRTRAPRGPGPSGNNSCRTSATACAP